MKTAESRKEYNVSWFRHLAPVYDIIEPFVRHIRKRVANEADLPKGARVLDMACGTGSQSIAFAENGYSVVGVDLSPDMLARAKRKIQAEHNITFLCQDATNIPYQDSYFDLSSISFGLHDMPEEIAISVLKEMRRTTKPGGKIIIVDYHTPQNRLVAFLSHRIAKLWESKYYDHFRKVGLQGYVSKAGLSIEKKETFLFGNAQMVTCTNKKS